MRACALLTCFLVQFYKSLSDHTLNKMKTENTSAYSRDKGLDTTRTPTKTSGVKPAVWGERGNMSIMPYLHLMKS